MDLLSRDQILQDLIFFGHIFYVFTFMASFKANICRALWSSHPSRIIGSLFFLPKITKGQIEPFIESWIHCKKKSTRPSYFRLWTPTFGVWRTGYVWLIWNLYVFVVWHQRLVFKHYFSFTKILENYTIQNLSLLAPKVGLKLKFYGSTW